jgi:hypothetical protein
MRRISWGLVAALTLGLVGGASVGACVKSPAPPPPQKNEIMALWTQIRDWRLDAGLPVDPEASSLTGMKGTTVIKARAVCEPEPVSATCNDVCDLADAICDNAERICDLASELPGDSWAADKCTSSKASCKEAKQRCCTCDERAARQHLRDDDEDRAN